MELLRSHWRDKETPDPPAEVGCAKRSIHPKQPRPIRSERPLESPTRPSPPAIPCVSLRSHPRRLRVRATKRLIPLQRRRVSPRSRAAYRGLTHYKSTSSEPPSSWVAAAREGSRPTHRRFDRLQISPQHSPDSVQYRRGRAAGLRHQRAVLVARPGPRVELPHLGLPSRPGILLVALGSQSPRFGAPRLGRHRPATHQVDSPRMTASEPPSMKTIWPHRWAFSSLTSQASR